MDFKNYICPVCGNRFTEDDDVVVCPDCGTPHHRECYLKDGKCFNFHLHGNDENLKNNYSVKEDEKIIDPNENFSFSMPNEKNDENTSGIPVPNILKDFSSQGFSSSPASTNLIEGKPAVYYEIAVKKNQRYYIPRFTGMSAFNRNISINFFALVFPFTFSVYRKMHKLAALIFAIYMVIFGVTSFNMYYKTDLFNVTRSCVEEDLYFLTDVYEYLETGEGELTDNQKRFIEESEKGQLPVGVSYAFSLIGMAVKILMGIKANSLYMKKIKKTVEDGEKKGLTGDMLKAYIYRKNGTLPIIIAVITGLFEVLFI